LQVAGNSPWLGIPAVDEASLGETSSYSKNVDRTSMAETVIRRRVWIRVVCGQSVDSLTKRPFTRSAERCRHARIRAWCERPISHNISSNNSGQILQVLWCSLPKTTHEC